MSPHSSADLFGHALTSTVITQLFRLMAYKDEYEVARLATRTKSSGGEQKLRQRFDGPVRVSYNLNPPSLRRFGLGKLQVGPWLRPALRLLGRMKILRGSRLDPFGASVCRRLERELINWYVSCVERLLKGLNADNQSQLVQLLRPVDEIRGYEHVKITAAQQAMAQVEKGLSRWEGIAEAMTGDGKSVAG